METNGMLQVITGGMFSGKSEELERRINRYKHKYGKKAIEKYTHILDVRKHRSIKAVKIKSVDEIKGDRFIIAIDEMQFFTKDSNRYTVSKIIELSKTHIVLISGLDMDFSGEPFMLIASLMARADFVNKFHAVCMQCRGEATFSYTESEVNGFLVGSQEYKALCRKCYFEKKGLN
jgi:thymidine kinase